jgi:hypothetical protein
MCIIYVTLYSITFYCTVHNFRSATINNLGGFYIFDLDWIAAVTMPWAYLVHFWLRVKSDCGNVISHYTSRLIWSGECLWDRHDSVYFTSGLEWRSAVTQPWVCVSSILFGVKSGYIPAILHFVQSERRLLQRSVNPCFAFDLEWRLAVTAPGAYTCLQFLSL